MTLMHAQKRGLEAAILAYLTAEGDRFARTVAAFKEEEKAAGGGDNDDNELVVSGEVLEKAWTSVLEQCEDIVLFDAVDSGDLVSVQLFQCIGVDTKAARLGIDRWSALYLASYNNRENIVQFFVQCGHDPEEGNRYGCSPLHVAAEEGHMGVVQYLVEQGADKNKTNNNGTTPVHIAAQNGHFTAVKCLLEHGAEVDKARNDGRTPLMAACLKGHVDVAEYLLDHGCDRERTDSQGWTALHWSLQGGSGGCKMMEVVQLLFRYGINLDARSNDGKLAIDYAIEFGYHDIADAFRAEEIRRRDHGFKRDRSTIPGTEENEAAKRPPVQLKDVGDDEEGGDDDDDDDEEDEEEEDDERVDVMKGVGKDAAGTR